MGSPVHIPAKEVFSPNADNDSSEIFCDVFEENRSFFLDGAVCAAIDLGIFELLTHSLTCRQLSVQLGTQPHRLRALLNVLVLEGMLKYEQKGATYVVRARPEHRPVVPEYGWGRLAQVIKIDRPLSEIDSSEDPPDSMARFHDHLFEIGYPAAWRMWEYTGIGSGHLIDIGSGSGAYSAAFLEMYRDARATLVDCEEVLVLARHRLKNHANRARFEPRDALKVVPGQYDTVLLANMLHLYGPSDCTKLIAAAAQSLQQGGCLVVKDLWIEPDRTAPAVSAYFALNMALYTKAGDVYPENQVSRWIKGAGFTDLQVLNNSRSLIVIATKTPKASL